MTRKLPNEIARVTGAADKNPARYRDSGDVDDDPELGDPPRWLTQPQRAAWRVFARELPWLKRSHRALLEIAAVLRARLEAGDEVGVQALNLLRLTLGQLGATPVDRHRLAPATPKVADPADEFFG